LDEFILLAYGGDGKIKLTINYSCIVIFACLNLV